VKSVGRPVIGEKRCDTFGNRIPIPNQSAIFVGFVIGSSAYYRIRLRRLFLAALISSLIWNRNNPLKRALEIFQVEKYPARGGISISKFRKMRKGLPTGI